MLNCPRSRLALLIFVSMVLRIGWAASLETGQDEAYHFLYTVHPDWSYFDHPPMLMYVARCGIAVFGGWIHPLSIRIGFILLFAGSTWIMFRWTATWFGESAGFYAALAMNLTAYYSAAAGAFVLPDGPLLFFALLTMWQVSVALVPSGGGGTSFSETPEFTEISNRGIFETSSAPVTENSADSKTESHEAKNLADVHSNPRPSLRPWIWVGIGCAGAMLSKYHAVFLPLGTLAYVLVTPSARRILLTPGPYIASALGILGLIPVLIWNSQHDWASFGFQTARAVGGKFQIVGLLVMFFGPMALLLPWIWYSLVETLVVRIPSLRSSTGIERLLLCMALLPISLFAVVSCTRPILPHWPLIGFLPLFPMLGANWATRSLTKPLSVHRWLVFMTSALLLMATAFLLQARFGLIKFPFRDPCIEISGWESVGKELADRGIIDRPNTFLFTSQWFDSGQLAFAVRNRMPVACYRQGDARGFAFWSKPEDWLAMDGILIDTTQQDDLIKNYEPYFREITPLAPIQMTRSGRPFRKIRAYLCTDQLRPYPFVYQHEPR